MIQAVGITINKMLETFWIISLGYAVMQKAILGSLFRAAGHAPAKARLEIAVPAFDNRWSGKAGLHQMKV
jgi:hypothetical protein